MHIHDTHFDPQLTLIDSAQVFQWNYADGTFSACFNGRHVQLTMEKDGFLLHNVDKSEISFWRNYFDLDTDYEAIASACIEPLARHAMQLLPGLRVLNQPPWETTVSFILSANNNVSRIRQLVGRMIDICGVDGRFPSPEEIVAAGEDALRAMGCGYRAPYLIRTSQMILDGFPLERLREMPYDEAHAYLLTLHGVGDKVADCIQLFSMGHREAFPVDVWVERLMRNWFIPEAYSKKEIRDSASRLFGKNAGIIQQSLFHCARLGLIPLEDHQ